METESLKKMGSHSWDVIVVGTGVGGATIGYQMARQGLRVLFLEKGLFLAGDSKGLKGLYPECHPSWRRGDFEDFSRLLALSGRRWEALWEGEGFALKRFIPFLGAGVGGSSLLFGGAMERLFPHDFHAHERHRSSAQTTLPARWPITYEELEPYYLAAEKLYGVRGTEDPLKKVSQYGYLPPPPLTPPARELRDFFQDKGFHPYQLPVAVRDPRDCPGCQGFLCPRSCKNDSATVCVEPAVKDHGAGCMDRCVVHSLVLKKNRVEAVRCWHNGQPLHLKANVFILAAGAIDSPLILLRSLKEHPGLSMPVGIQLLGRNLMRHHVDLYAVLTHSTEGLPTNRKEIAFNDFYLTPTGKYGTVQSFGALPPGPVILHELESLCPRPLRPYLKKMAPAVDCLVEKLFSRTMILAAIKEDLPYEENRVEWLEKDPDDHSQGKIVYRLSETERRAIQDFRTLVCSALRPYRFVTLKEAENNRRLAHACGTCRFGEDPKRSVLDRNNKMHGLSNLYVVDASFFPTSGGTNPSLTIAANALRVGERILAGS